MGLALLHLGLLETDEVRIQPQHRFLKSFFQTGPQAVDVP